ncbi:hypothetical protein [Enterovibrio calviensis]|uniref:hypothetical protein n=1 Tax=Enterovibrio calviensis TaxID=91359 RepID=UPI003734EEBB
MNTKLYISILSIVFGALANAGAGILLKKSTSKYNGESIEFFLLISSSVFCYALAFGFYFLALRALPIYLAYIVMTGLACSFLVIYSSLIDRDTLSYLQYLGILFILIGIFFTVISNASGVQK